MIPMAIRVLFFVIFPVLHIGVGAIVMDGNDEVKDAIDIDPEGDNPVHIKDFPVLRGPSEGDETNSDGKGKVIFLLMLGNSLAQEQAWSFFLTDAKKGRDYELITHCTHRSECLKNSLLSKHEIIKTVPSAWCELVGVMNSLLEAGLKKSTGDSKNFDKFVFVSGNTVPVKSFQHAWHSLIAANPVKSDFCIHPASEWPEIDDTKLLVKHHQWIALSRPHVMKALYNPVVNLTLPDMQDLDGCLDEYHHFAALYGLAHKTRHKGVFKLDGFHGDELHVGDDASKHVQGHCDTFAYWQVDLGQGFSELFTKIRGNLHLTVDPVYHRVVHPAAVFVEQNSSATIDPEETEQAAFLEMGASTYDSEPKACIDKWDPYWSESSTEACQDWLTNRVWGALMNGKSAEKACAAEWAKVNCAHTCGCGKTKPFAVAEKPVALAEMQQNDRILLEGSMQNAKAGAQSQVGLTTNAVQHLRESPFLFIRKVEKDAVFRDGNMTMPLAFALEHYIYAPSRLEPL